MVSRYHCVIRLENGGALMVDLESNNGTFVDGASAPRGVWTQVRHGAALRFGPLEMSVRLE